MSRDDNVRVFEDTEAMCKGNNRLYFCLNQQNMWDSFYKPYRAAHDPVYNADIIYTSGVVAIKSDTEDPVTMPEEKWMTLDIVTCAAPDYEGYWYHYDSDVLRKMLEAFLNWEERPAACSMDICVTENGRTLLVELNDAYSLGCYGLPGVPYAKFISARWSQLLSCKDEFRF